MPKELSKASILAKQQGIKNVDYRVYHINFPEKYHFDQYEDKDNQKILNFFNKEFGTHITMKQINDPKLEQILQHDNKMSEDAFISGTPSMFFDGNYDITRSKYEKFLK